MRTPLLPPFPYQFSRDLSACITALAVIWRIAGFVTRPSTSSDDDDAPVHNQRVFNWRLYLSVLTILTFVLWLFAATDLMWTALILGLLPAALALVRGWVEPISLMNPKIIFLAKTRNRMRLRSRNMSLKPLNVVGNRGRGDR